MQNHHFFPYILETHVTDHCNLNCSGCTHFAPLVKGEAFTDKKIFENDLKRFKQLFADLYEIRLIGGEPLLHPDLVFFCEFTRKIYPKTNISIFTNGMKLLEMPDIFWRTCSEKDILIKLSYYPINLDIDQIKQKAKAHRVRIKIPKQIHQFMKILNINGDSNPRQSFQNCQAMYKTPFLGHGKVYPCPLPPHIHFFNDYFSKHIPVTEKDYINIHEDVSPADIMNFVNQSIPMCKWCISKRPFAKWARSGKDINEWIGVNEKFIKHFIRMAEFRVISLYQQAKKRAKIK